MLEPTDLSIGSYSYPGLRRPGNLVSLLLPGVRNRVIVEGKHLALNGAPFRVRGVTYGGFRPRDDGAEFPENARVRADFEHMVRAGLNVVRTYTAPPDDVLEAAEEHGLRVLVGLHYEDWRVADGTGRRARRRVLDAGLAAVEEAVERCRDRDCVLAIVVGNEVPGDLVRLHGIRSIETILSRLVDDVHDAGLLATYCNYPTTEYLDVGGQDFTSFNVFLEDEPSLRAYLRHLQVVSADMPLVITELGLAGDVHGEAAQASLLESQLRLIDEAGCAGATVFSWTDEWFVGGFDVDGWGFGLTDRDRRPKRALDAVSVWALSDVRDLRTHWPRISVIVCAYNEERRILECLRSLERCAYPDLEVIVCDDGSTDRTLEIARRFPFTVIALPHGGLSAARNAGLAAATGEIVAYIDADAAAHPEWPFHLALAFEDELVAAAGGPNLPVPGAGFVEHAVSHSPGGPIHVLLSDVRAEHVPGCNMAFRKQTLLDIGGFDPIFTAAGDDVDVCWKTLDAGGQIAYVPAAQVLHHRRDKVRDYLRQQRSYGKAERVVSGRHPHRYDRLGRARWSGSIYGGPRMLPALLRPVIYHGNLGLAPFQGVVRRRSAFVLAWAGALVPVVAPALLLGALAPASLRWLIPSAAAAVILAAYATTIGFAVRPPRDQRHAFLFRVVVALLHLGQPVARTWGRLRGRPARLPATGSQPAGDRARWIEDLRRDLARRRCSVRLGGGHDGWDLEVRAGPFLACRVTTGLAWGHEARWRTRVRPRWPLAVAVVASSGIGAAQPRAASVLPVALAVVLLVEGRLLWGRLRASMARPERSRPAERPTLHVARRPPPAARRTEIETRLEPPARTDRGLARRIFGEGRSFRGRLAGLFLLGFLETPLLLLSPIPLKIAVDSVIGTRPLPGFVEWVLPGSATSSGTRVLAAAAILQVIVIVLINLQLMAKDLVGAQIGEGLTLGLRAKLFAQLQRLSLAFHDSRGTADSMYRIQYDAPSAQEYLIKGVLPLAASGVALVSMIYVTARIDWQLALVGLGVSPFLFLLARSYKTTLRARHRHTKELESSALKVVQEVLTGLRVVKAFVREEVEQDRFLDRSSAGMRARVRLVLAQGALATLVSLVTAIGTAAVLFIGVRNVQAGTLTVGELLVVLAYLGQLYAPLRTISKQSVQLQSALAGAERVFDLLDRYPDVIDPPEARRIVRAKGTLELRGVSFSYGEEEPVLRDVTLNVPAGTRLGIVGATGAGKTTLASLLLRFFEPSEGTILLDGADIREYSVASLRRQIALVLQESMLFSASVRENIAYGKPGARDEEIVEAAKLARAHEFIERLPHGYDTLVGERGMLLSGGERQRIALARAFLKDAPILILDEPTSAVDAATEGLIVEAMTELMEGRTTLVISHRPSALRHCTAIVRVEDGRLVPTSDQAIAGEAARPLLQPRRPTFVRAPTVDADHEALRAWGLVSENGRTPHSIERLTTGRKTKSIIYRLGGAAPDGGTVIAKQERPDVVRLERRIYEDVLPSLRIDSIRCFGAVEQDDASWIFIEDANGEPFSESDPVHRAAAALWMGSMHIASGERMDLAACLPSQGPDRYAEHLRRARKTIVENLSNPEIKRDDVEILRAVLGHFDDLESRWSEMSEFCDAVPSCLVHGDFAPKNAQIQWRNEQPTFLLMDWETAGWGAPGPDVMRLDPDVYASAIEAGWPHLEPADIRELARIGTIFRALAAISWDSRMLAYPWVDTALRNIRGYEGWLRLARSGAAYRIGSASL